MSDPDHMLGWSNGMGDDLPERLWGYDDPTALEARSSASLPAGLISLAFITAALKRRAWLWCLTAALGLLIGSGLYVKYPPAYHASASVLLADNPNQDAATQVENDQAMAQSQGVAALVVGQLRLPQTVSSFQAASTVTIVTNNVLLFNVGAPSASEAVARVTALATVFLKFRAQYDLAVQQQQLSELDQQFSQAQTSLDSINAQISQLSAGSGSPSAKTELAKLETQREIEGQVESYATSTKATTKTTTSAMVHDSRLLGAAIAIPPSRTKGAGLYVVSGLFGGLAVGVIIVIITALVSDRLYRRDDVAEAIGAPVRLSVGTLRKRRLPGRPGRAARRDRDMKRVVVHLRAMVPGRSRPPVGLVVVAVDNARDVAPAVMSLAATYAHDGKQVVVADLADGALANLLDAKGPGIRPVTAGGERMTAVVPDRHDIAPVGPFQALAPHPPASDDLLAACSSADLVFTLATLDPAFGGDHLATWATDAVAIVTAGRSSAERVHAVGEMSRLAGMRLDSVVLTGAEKSDESLGMTPTPRESSQVGLD